MNAQYWIDKLGLEPHPEGGYYKEVYRNPNTIQIMGGGGTRNLSTSIYFLLEGSQKSHFHQLSSDELWYFHAGSGARVHVLNHGEYSEHLLGLNLEAGDLPQLLLPARSIFASEVSAPDSYVLMGCMVNPGFDFKDFRMLTASELEESYPGQKALIREFTLGE
ncbi:cupin domain-containing protein [Marinoscillum sp. 108]|uniref:cupin domain-containing protein n=1 Tax=Marinoscillum sp. 108 TaxID=2653151 RepID=UPI0012F221B6|nr:cupin domain-containing protein [Marinoscillum sp. 108]VXD21500.1 conserved hypothetical protein [Marinoscillum sp. 108]